VRFISMVEQLTQCFYSYPENIKIMADADERRVGTTALLPIVIELVSLYIEAPTEDLEEEILCNIIKLGLHYDAIE